MLQYTFSRSYKMPYTNDLKKVWEKVIERFSSSLPQGTIDNMLRPIVIESFDGEEAVMSVSSEYRHKLLVDKYVTKFRDMISEMLDKEITIVFRYSGDSAYYIKEMSERYNLNPENGIAIIFRPDMPLEQEIKLNKERVKDKKVPFYNYQYTFDNFIVGSSNKFAHAAAYAVASNPACDYNPLFIYGQSGLGKTHLLYAITNKLVTDDPNTKIIYIKGDDFTNQLIESIKEQKMERFRARYRSCDVLLIDDIQFIAGKTSTQEEFFHTFNALYEEHKQIILTSDRPPSEIKTLEYRLVTRFEWGLIADIQPPDLELRLAITRKKAEEAGAKVPDEVCVFLAENLRTNFRQVEGSIRKLRALSFLRGEPITMEMAHTCIKELLGGAEPVSVTVDKVFATVYKKYGVSKEDIVGIRRTKEVANARHITAYLIRTITEMSFQNIGKILGRDYSTVIASIEVVERKLRNDPPFNIEIDEMIKEIDVR